MSQQLVVNETERQLAVSHEELDRLIQGGGGSGGSTHDAAVATTFMKWAQQNHILLTPMQASARLRDGLEWSFTKLQISTAKEAKLTFPVGGNEEDEAKGRNPKADLGLHKTAWDMIAANLGIKWVREERIDDGKDPLRCEIVIYGVYMGPDWTPQPIMGRGELRLHDDSAQVKKIRSQARNTQSAERKIVMQRSKIVQLTETNARVRAIVSFGARSSYTKEELDTKYIICARPIITGYSDDPVIRRMFAQDMIDSSRRAMAAIYGDDPALPPPPMGGSLALDAAVNAPRQLGTNATSEPSLGTATTSLVHIHFSDSEQCSTTREGEKYVETDQIDKVTCPTCQELICMPKRCLGIKGRFHIEACYGNTQEDSKPADNAWEIPTGSAKGLKINDPRVTPETLLALRTEYSTMLNPKGALYEMMGDEQKDFASSALREVQKEIGRRGIKETEKY